MITDVDLTPIFEKNSQTLDLPVEQDQIWIPITFPFQDKTYQTGFSLSTPVENTPEFLEVLTAQVKGMVWNISKRLQKDMETKQ
mgnify:CR=1 FL=1